MQRLSINDLWTVRQDEYWRRAEEYYWSFVKPANLNVEKEFDALDVACVKAMDSSGWYEFLLRKYFRWKYTAPNRYASTTKQLRKYAESSSLDELDKIREGLFTLDLRDARASLVFASSIKGLGTAGASGLLAVLFPREFGTVDQFAVKALSQIENLPEGSQVRRMNPENLSIKNAVVLIDIMRAKASENNREFATNYWTPRKIDKILWTYGRRNRAETSETCASKV